MSHPEQSNEPTMEEILASIRRIISDDDNGAADAAAQARAEPLAPEPDATTMTEPARHQDAAPEPTAQADSATEEQDMAGQAKEEEDAGVFELTDEVAEGGNQPDGAEPSDKTVEAAEAKDAPAEVVFAENEAGNEDEMDKEFGADAAAPAAETGAPARDLMSNQSHQSVQQTFASLENFVMSTHARTLEDLVTEMMRPILREWLDANLPPLTERLVREEIERVSRGRR